MRFSARIGCYWKFFCTFAAISRNIESSKMINRTLLRTKTVQVLYAMYTKHNLDLHAAESELAMSARKSYDLYNYILMLLVEVYNAACTKNELAHNRLSGIGNAETVNERFINNRFIKQLAENNRLRVYAEDARLSWADRQDFVKGMMNSVLHSEYYLNWLKTETDDYDTDKELWRKIARKELTDNDELADTIEEDNVYWQCGLDLVIEFTIKTIKTFAEENGSEQPLLPMFDEAKGENMKYATDLIDNVLLNDAKTDEEIVKYLKNWDYNRISLIDKVVLKCAIGEMETSRNTPHNIIINEYVEIAKYFSSPKNAKFVNGILDRISTERKAASPFEQTLS